MSGYESDTSEDQQGASTGFKFLTRKMSSASQWSHDTTSSPSHLSPQSTLGSGGVPNCFSRRSSGSSLATQVTDLDRDEDTSCPTTPVPEIHEPPPVQVPFLKPGYYGLSEEELMDKVTSSADGIDPKEPVEGDVLDQMKTLGISDTDRTRIVTSLGACRYVAYPGSTDSLLPPGDRIGTVADSYFEMTKGYKLKDDQSLLKIAVSFGDSCKTGEIKSLLCRTQSQIASIQQEQSREHNRPDPPMGSLPRRLSRTLSRIASHVSLRPSSRSRTPRPRDQEGHPSSPASQDPPTLVVPSNAGGTAIRADQDWDAGAESGDESSNGLPNMMNKLRRLSTGARSAAGSRAAPSPSPVPALSPSTSQTKAEQYTALAKVVAALGIGETWK